MGLRGLVELVIPAEQAIISVAKVRTSQDRSTECEKRAGSSVIRWARMTIWLCAMVIVAPTVFCPLPKKARRSLASRFTEVKLAGKGQVQVS